MPKARPYLGIEGEMRLAALHVLSLVDLSDEHMLAAYDKIVSRVSLTGVSFKEAAEQLDETVRTGMLTNLIVGYLNHWSEGGSAALLSLVDSADLASLPQQDGAFDAHTLQLTVAVLTPLAISRANDVSGLERKYLPFAGGNLLSLARWLDVTDHTAAARECAVLAADLLRRCDDERAAPACQFALRLLDEAEKRAFLALVPRAKYPPPIEPTLTPAVTEDVVLGALQQLLLSGQPGSVSGHDEFEALAAQMLADRDWVLYHQAKWWRRRLSASRCVSLHLFCNGYRYYARAWTSTKSPCAPA